ncbi:MAG: CDP-diacylglycerol--serine O-phosphatidyltransferase [Pseudomonadota bacterium]|nr:CDP-diacylglycerol--serine O-phosphatidyltransferase [Pseudomonadota bacterium]
MDNIDKPTLDKPDFDKPNLKVVSEEQDEAASPEAEHNPRAAHAGLGRRGVFLLPNLVTTGSLFAGFYAIVTSMNGQPLTACLAIFLAMLLDGADGRIARMTGTQSAFGAQYDSLSDLVAFGVAPALVAFSWGLSALGQLGWVAAFAYMACAALRLARFNVDGEEGSFTGLASPAAAGVIVFSIWVALEQGMAQPPLLVALLFAALTVTAALLMVSNYDYFSPKKINFRERIPFVTLVLIAMGFAVAMIDPPMVMLGIALIYAASGPAKGVWKNLQRRT